ncbi:GlsB/YeaQ/YmgE family stress response membrane protein [Ramlibacter sp. AN1133]|uniref:GlsB/YeaQ/YmgE family stress response membrane protein n=1 Tax=Ramlibacter sp. AN1133 TaxID=3133429 RepID=UPI0030C1D35F
MNPFIWCVVGALAGWIAGVFVPTRSLINRIENVLVGVFGAFIGGEFVARVALGTTPGSGFQASSLMLAIAGAIGLLGLLSVMRKAVGPMRPHKLRKKPRP